VGPLGGGGGGGGSSTASGLTASLDFFEHPVDAMAQAHESVSSVARAVIRICMVVSSSWLGWPS
jgi:hypothetical protein